MLTGMLLHVIQTTRPIQALSHLRALLKAAARLHKVDSCASLAHNAAHWLTIDRPIVAGLTAALWEQNGVLTDHVKAPQRTSLRAVVVLTAQVKGGIITGDDRRLELHKNQIELINTLHSFHWHVYLLKETVFTCGFHILLQLLHQVQMLLGAASVKF